MSKFLFYEDCTHNMTDVSIIIVNFNTKDLTNNCLASIYTQTRDVLFEVIVSDNGSTDGSIEMIRREFPQVILIENGRNLGFGAANNRAARVAKGKYLLLLNSDTVLLNNAVGMLFTVAEKNEGHIYGGYLYTQEGKVTHSYYSFVTPLRLLVRSLYLYFPFLLRIRSFVGIKEIVPVDKMVDGIIGADLFISKSIFSKLNGFDERFFMYCEDEDLCWRAKHELSPSVTCKVISGPKIMHLESASFKIAAKKRKAMLTSYKCYFRKRFVDGILLPSKGDAK